MGNPQYLKVLATRGRAHGDSGGTAGTDAGMAISGELVGLDHTSLAVVRAAAVLGERPLPAIAMLALRARVIPEFGQVQGS